MAGDRARVARREADGVARRLQCRGVGYRQRHGGGRGIEVAGCCIAQTDGREKVFTRLAIERQTQPVLRVHRLADGDGHAAEQVAAFGEVVVLKAQQARHLAPAEHAFVQFHLGGGARRQKAQHLFAAARAKIDWIVNRQRGSLVAQHQRLAAGHEHADRAVVGGHLRCLDVLVELADELVALVEQVVGGLAVALGTGNLLVDAGDVLGQAVDRDHAALELFGHGVADFVQALRGVAHARGGFVHAREGHAARSEVGGGAHDIRERIHHVVDGCANAAGAAAENLLQLAQAVHAHGVARIHRRCGRGLAREQLAVVALDGLHIHALANVATAGELALHGLQHHGLARIAGRADVGNVVACGLQGRLVGQKGAGSDVEQAHGLPCVLRPVRAARAGHC